MGGARALVKAPASASSHLTRPGYRETIPQPVSALGHPSLAQMMMPAVEAAEFLQSRRA
jgi:hypothetical protein